MAVIWIGTGRFAPAYDPDAQAYITAVEAADTQALEVGVKDAINAFVVGCKADGIWSAIKASCIMAGARTLAGALVPLVGAAPTRFGTEGGWNYNRKTGLVGDGTNNYLDSNRNNDADPQNSKHITVYVGAAPTITSCLIGARQGPLQEQGSSQIIHVGSTDSNFRVHSAAFATSASGIGTGFAGTTRTGTAALNWRHSSTFTGSNATASQTSQTPFSISIHVFRRSGSSGNVPTNARIAFYSIGESLDLALLDARVTALINAFAAAIP